MPKLLLILIQTDEPQLDVYQHLDLDWYLENESVQHDFQEPLCRW